MGSNWVSEVSAGAGERVGRMVNGTSLTSGSIAGLGVCGDGRPIWGWRFVSTMSWQTMGSLVRRSWFEGSEERIWKPFLRICLRQRQPG